MKPSGLSGMTTDKTKTFLEFFAGIGLVHLGLRKSGWKCVYANDISEKKMEMYLDEFPAMDYYHREDVWKTNEVVDRITAPALLATASFPCIDLSLAGQMRGLDGDHSGSLFGFVRVLKELKNHGRLPKMIMLENVVGLLTGRNGEDFRKTCQSVAELGFYLDALIVDAKYFTPQSRPRLFIIGVVAGAVPPSSARENTPLFVARLNRRVNSCNPRLREAVRNTSLPTGWIAFDTPNLTPTKMSLADVIDTDEHQAWWSQEEVDKHLARTSEAHRHKIEWYRESGKTWISTMFRRIRQGTTRVEARFDGIAGCLRTANGGSARQIVILVQNHQIKMRWMTPREYARLQGAPLFNIQRGVNQTLTGFGDGVCVPVIEWIDRHILSEVASYLGYGEPQQTAIIAHNEQLTFNEITFFSG
jgi:DNA (cytosine-5)-methyltransferase 1